MPTDRKRPKTIRPCRICKSPYRAEMEFLVGQKYSPNMVAKKYCQKFDCAAPNLYLMLQRHIKDEHPPLLDETPPKEPVRGESFEDYANQLLKVGLSPDLMNAKKVSHAQVISAKRALLEEKKVNNEINAQKLAFMKFFRGVPPNAIEGEVVDERSNDQDGVKNIPSNTD